MSESGTTRSYTPGRRMVTSFVVAEFLLLAGNLLVRVSQREAWFSTQINAVIAVVAAVPMCWFAIQFFRMLRSDLDEMIQRVVLEGLTFALVIFVPLAGLYVNLRVAGLISVNLDPPELLLAPSILAAIGILISWSRLK